MRITTAFRFDESVDNLQRRQREMSDAQAAMTNGKRINKPSDDPTGAAKAERAFLAQQRIEYEQRLVAASRNALTLGESTLGHAVELLQTAREAIVTAGNGTYTASERQAQVDQLRNLRSQLMSLANQDDGAGGFIFGGQSNHTQPFADTATGVVFNGTEGEQQISARERLPTSMDGQAVWLSAPSGNGVFESAAKPGNTGSAWITAGTVSDPAAITGSNYELVFTGTGPATTYSVLVNGAVTTSGVPYQSGVDIAVDGMKFVIKGQPGEGDSFSLNPSTASLDPFEAIDKAISTLSRSNASAAQISQTVNNGLRDLDSVLRQFQAARASAGASLNRLDSVDARNQDRTLWAQTLQSDVEDIDMVKAISEFQNRQTGYQAALQSYALVQRMSLMDYIK